MMIKVNPITEKQINLISSDEESCQAKTVLVAIEFCRIGEIDTMNEKYHAEIQIETRWIENDVIDEYDAEKHWNPKLFIEKYI